MKKFRLALSISLIVPALFAPALAYAHSGEDDKPVTTTSAKPASSPVTGSSNSGNDSTKDQNEDTTDDTPKIATPSTDATERGKRLEALKSSLKVKLDEVTKKKIILKCKPAQTIVEGAEKADTVIGEKRRTAYSNIASKMDALVVKLKANNIDTTELEGVIATLKEKIATFTTDMSAYQQALTDLRTLDCATDPTAFQAALTSTRSAREKVRADALAIRDYVKTTLKPALETIKTKLEAQKSNSTEEGNQ